MRPSKNIVNVFVGCCSSAFLMEIIMSKLPQSANLITFLQSLFVSLHGYFFTVKFGTIKPKIPLKKYAILVALFFTTHVANNYVYALHVSSTLHMIVRAASTPASMVVYCIAKKQSPKVSNAIGSVLISIGIAIAVYGGASTVQKETEFKYWCLGVAILLTTLVTGALTGLQQEVLYQKYGKHPEEMMFYTHALPLPFFGLIYPQLRDNAISLTSGIWFLIAINIVSQYFATFSVHQLASKETTVTVTFILTVRKFVSLLLSSLVFKNSLTLYHVIGSIFVCVGTCIYFNFFSYRKQRPVAYENEKKNH